MSASADRPEFTPPPTRGLLRAIGLAILAHAALVAALTWGVRWKRDADLVAVQAELWASVPVQAAPAAQPPAPTVPKPEPVAAKAEPKPVAKPDIALERERERERQRKQEAETIEQTKSKRQAEQQRAKELRAKEQQEKEEAAQRKAHLARMAGLAGATGATGSATSSGAALQSAGPSATYAGRVIARIKPNIVFTETPTGNPTTVVEVRTAQDGTITGRRLLRASGQRAWDEAVMKALDKTDALPKDTDGRVPPVLEISFRPQD